MSDAPGPKGPPQSSRPEEDPGANTEMFHRFVDEEYDIQPEKKRPSGVLIGLIAGVLVVAVIVALFASLAGS